MKKLLEAWAEYSPWLGAMIVGYFLYWKKYMEENSIGKLKANALEEENKKLVARVGELEIELRKQNVEVARVDGCLKAIEALKKDADTNWRITTELTLAIGNLKNAFEEKFLNKN